MTARPDLEAWRAARDDARRLRAAMLVTLAEIGEAARQVALGLASPKKRAAIVPLPEVVDMSVVSLAELEWFKQLPKGKRDEYRAAVEPLGRRIADAYGEVAAADRRCSDLAAEVSGPVVGEDASWRWCAATSVVSYSSQGYGARRYAMASAALRWQDMVELGYRARAIMRRAKVPAECHCGPHASFEVRVWTCDEGAAIAPHQTPARSMAESLRRAADQGVNPAALWPVPSRLVEAADAWRPRGPAPVVPWENVAHDESIV